MTAPRATKDAGAPGVERVQTGIRLEKRVLKVLKGIAEIHDMSLGDLIEGIALHVMEGRLPFGDDTLATVAKLKEIYGLDLSATDSHRLMAVNTAQVRRKGTHKR